MYNHAPKNYKCPFCEITKGGDSDFAKFNTNYLVYQGKDISAFISSKRWPYNPGIVLIIPHKHYENLYEVPDGLLKKISILTKKIALAMKKGYRCEGVSTRQHNEPAGNQSVWHFHLQVCPRYNKDSFYLNYDKKADIAPEDRAKCAKIIKNALKKYE